MSFYSPYQAPMFAQPMAEQYRQPYQFSQPQVQPQIQTQQQSGMIWVQNRMEADRYPVAPNTAIALWDLSGPFVHRKETDVSGRPVVKTYKLVEVTEAQQTANQPQTEYLTRQEFLAFVDGLNASGYSPKFTQKEEPVNE